MVKASIYIVFFISSLAYSGSTLKYVSAPKSKEEFCSKSSKIAHQQNMLSNLTNRLAFVNHGGVFNGGTCWWHSRFTRAATYLFYFAPDKPKPTSDQAKQIIEDITWMNKVIEVPGYRNLFEFSFEWKDLIQDKLNWWQFWDGARFSWVQGLDGESFTGKNETNAEVYKRRMTDIYSQVFYLKKVPYLRLQVPGIAAHAWLIIDMLKTSDGYDLHYVDSNEMTLGVYSYKNGDVSTVIRNWGESVVYLEQESELNSMEDIVSNFCKKL